MSSRLSQAHVAAVNRPRRVVNHFDANFAITIAPLKGGTQARPRIGATIANLLPEHPNVDAFVKHLFTFTDADGSRTDSIWWDLGMLDSPGPWDPWTRLEDERTDIVRILVDETHKRGLEAFYSHRMNGETGPIPEKMDHPDWQFRPPWLRDDRAGYWNFAVEGARDFVLGNLRKLAREHDFDGLQLDYARGVVLPPGRQWEQRDEVTRLMRGLRAATLEVEEKRGRPFLLAARVPENLQGCHFDGLDVETWVNEELLDIFVLGCRSFDVDIQAFRRITEGAAIKLYPGLDDHHASDGYQNPGIEVFRGVAASWWRQGADGIETFNFNYAPYSPYGNQDWPSHLLAYQELHSPEALRRKDKVFVVQRRGGGHGPTVVPNAEDWSTPRFSYANSNMFAPLPAGLANDGNADTLLMVNVADDLTAESRYVRRVTLRVLLSDPEAERLPAAQRLDTLTLATIGHAGNLRNSPPANGIVDGIEMRLNNALLDRATVDRGWLVFSAGPDQFAVGNNLVGVRVVDRARDAEGRVAIEKLEVHVTYR